MISGPYFIQIHPVYISWIYLPKTLHKINYDIAKRYFIIT